MRGRWTVIEGRGVSVGAALAGLAAAAVLAGGATAGPSQDAPKLGQESGFGPSFGPQFDLESGDETTNDVGPSLLLEVGRSPTRAAFALDIRGGAAHGWALLSVTDASGRSASELLTLDADGAARVLRYDHRAEEALAVECVIQRQPSAPAPTAKRSLVVPSAQAMIAHSAALVGVGAPNSPFASLGPAQPGVVITEIMKDPSAVADSAGEWFEVRNLGSAAIDLTGWTIRDAGSNSHTIPQTAGAVLPPRSYFVFGINSNPALNGGVSVGYKYSSFSLGNGADDIQLYDAAGLLVDAVAYDDGVLWPDAAGKSINLERALVDVTSNDDGANWCDALNPMHSGTTDCGTPRVANNTCP